MGNLSVVKWLHSLKRVDTSVFNIEKLLSIYDLATDIAQWLYEVGLIIDDKIIWKGSKYVD